MFFSRLLRSTAPPTTQTADKIRQRLLKEALPSKDRLNAQKISVDQIQPGLIPTDARGMALVLTKDLMIQ
jgi:hypothetical protein